MRAWIAMLGLMLGCESGGATNASPVGSGSAKPAAGSGKGFGADLLRELEGSGSAGAKAGSAAPKAGSAEPKVAAGSADPKAGSAEVKPPPDPKAGSGSATTKVAAGSAEPKAAGSAETKPPPDPKAGSGSAATKVAAEPKAAGSAEVKPPPDPKAGSASVKVAIQEPKPPVAVPGELKTIKLSLLPNWERDVDEAGTISLAVKVQGRPQPAVFRFRYGFEDPKAPTDRDAYKKWLTDNKVFVVRQDRQAGAAWFIEGTDGSSGAPAFRVVVYYGGRKLICGGSLYKDAESNKLGDLRDQTIIQAKQICESVAL